jgi:two-component system, LytTR family, sensor kinase
MADVVDLTDVPRPPRAWVAIAGWTAVAVVVALILSASNDLRPRTALPGAIVWYYSLGVLVWLACALDGRFELWRQARRRILLAHVGGGLLALGVWMAAMISIARLAIGPRYWNAVFGDWWMFQLMSNAMVYAAGVGIGLMVRSWDRERARERRQAQLEVSTREAELTAIKAQLQPHFLFNALNSIVALIEHDPQEARQMLIRLSSLLHGVFDRMEEPLVPLDRELEMIEEYLNIERIRFGDRMTFSIDAERAARRTAIPPFLLQPLVENAVKHGIEPSSRPAAVGITVRLDGGRLRLAVADTGSVVNGAQPVGQGRGLALTRQRLESVYGAQAFTMRTEHDVSGFTVILDLPIDTHVV